MRRGLPTARQRLYVRLAGTNDSRIRAWALLVPLRMVVDACPAHRAMLAATSFSRIEFRLRHEPRTAKLGRRCWAT